MVQPLGAGSSLPAFRLAKGGVLLRFATLFPLLQNRYFANCLVRVACAASSDTVCRVPFLQPIREIVGEGRPLPDIEPHLTGYKRT